MIFIAFVPLLICLCSSKDLNDDKSVTCLAISVAKIIPTQRFLKVLNSSLDRSEIKLNFFSLIRLNVSATWKFSYTL